MKNKPIISFGIYSVFIVIMDAVPIKCECWVSEQKSACDSCTAGLYNDGNMPNCSTCDIGMLPNSEQSYCTYCPSGTQVNDDMTACLSCPSGWISWYNMHCVTILFESMIWNIMYVIYWQGWCVRGEEGNPWEKIVFLGKSKFDWQTPGKAI